MPTNEPWLVLICRHGLHLLLVNEGAAAQCKHEGEDDYQFWALHWQSPDYSSQPH